MKYPDVAHYIPLYCIIWLINYPLNTIEPPLMTPVDRDAAHRSWQPMERAHRDHWTCLSCGGKIDDNSIYVYNMYNYIHLHDSRVSYQTSFWDVWILRKYIKQGSIVFNY